LPARSDKKRLPWKRHWNGRVQKGPDEAGGALMSTPYWLVYDGQCAFCRASVRLLRALDWFRRIRAVDLHTQAEEVAQRAPYLTHNQMMAAMQLITPAGKVYPGFFGFRQAAWLLPLAWALLPLLYLPGMSKLGPAIYAQIARRRYGLSRCGPDGACELRA